MPGHLGRGQYRSQGKDYGAKAGPGSGTYTWGAKGTVFLLTQGWCRGGPALLERALKMRTLRPISKARQMVSESFIKANKRTEGRKLLLMSEFFFGLDEVGTMDSTRWDLMFTWILFWNGQPIMAFCNPPSQVSKCSYKVAAQQTLAWCLMTSWMCNMAPEPCQRLLIYSFILLPAQSQTYWDDPTGAQSS